MSIKKALHISHQPDFEVKYLVLLLNLLILRVVIPYLEWLFVLFAFVSVIFILSERNRISLGTLHPRKTAKVFLPYLGTTLIFFFSFIFTSGKTFLLYREFLVALFLVYYIFLGMMVLDSPPALRSFVDRFKEQFIVITAIAALLGLIKFMLDIAGVGLSFLAESGYTPAGTSLKADHNFYSLGMAIGFVFVLEKIVRRSSGNKIYILILLLYSFNIVFSSSRRGIVLFLIINAGAVFMGIVGNRAFHIKLKSVSRILLVLVIILLLSIFGLYQYGKQADHFKLKQEIASILSDYKSVIHPDTNLADTYKSLWKSDYIEDWRKNKFKSENKINSESDGKSSMVLLGYNNDMIVNLESKPGWHRWMAMRTELISADTFKILRVQGAHPGACLYRFIGLGTGVTELSISMNLKIMKWNNIQRIELRWGKNKLVKRLLKSMNDGKWHHIDFLSRVDSSDKAQLVLYFTGSSPETYGEVLVQGLKLSSHPTRNHDSGITLGRLNHLKIDGGLFPEEIQSQVKVDSIPWNVGPNLFMDTLSYLANEFIYTYSDSLGGVLYKNIVIPFSQFWRYSADLLPYQAGKNLRIETRNLTVDNYTKGVYIPDRMLSENHSLRWIRLETIFYAEKGDIVRLGVRLFPDTVPQLVFWNNFRFTTYPYQEAVSLPKYIPDKIDMQFIKQQVERKRISDSIQQNEQADHFFVPRKLRWAYAVELYKNYPFWEKIVGGGFGYLRKFDKKFPSYTGYFKVEYPHNVFLSALLYSGLFGFVVFLWLM
ncbi:MAG: O-antigen ligase family protein, partial [Spirochaetaceae bacterium]|nr:O-antigen ligase family protein [Spirochaetaceae bacterium]